MSRKSFGDYYLGLDMGTNSVGWAVTDPSYHVLNFNGKAMWGIRLFDEAHTAAERRSFRTARRRNARKKQRIKLVQELLSGEISKVDPGFYLRMQESKFLEEDKDERVRQKFTLFADQHYTDVDYHREYPTIYHLRKALMDHAHKYDIRLYYLAISDFMKHRGHFLFAGNISQGPELKAASVEGTFRLLNSYLEKNYDFCLDPIDLNTMKEIIRNRSLGKKEKNEKLLEIFQVKGSGADSYLSQKKEMIKALSGSTVALDKLFNQPDLKDAEVKGFSFSDGIDDQKEDALREELGENFELISHLKMVYDAGILEGLLAGCNSFSEAQINIYNQHKRNLKDLKAVVRKYIPGQYHALFSDPDNRNSYTAYVGYSDGQPIADKRITGQHEFCTVVKKLLDGIQSDDETLQKIKSDCENGTFMPKPISKNNTVIPYQIHERELRLILKHMGEDYPDLERKDESGLSACDKILKTFTFRIPYYVGPLNSFHSDKGGNSWSVRKETGKIYPWNFEQKIDQEASAEKFISRMTNKCTYLIGEDVLPKDSLLYSRFMVLNELNNLRIDGERISVELKQRLYEDVFQKGAIKGNISLKKLQEWMISQNLCSRDNIFSGIDEEFKSKLTSFQDFYKILGNRVFTEQKMIEDIIFNVVIFGDDKKLLTQRIEKKYGSKISKKELKRILKLHYSGWGRLSRKILDGIEDANHETGEAQTIIQAMWNGQENFMELLSNKYSYASVIREENDKIVGDGQKISYELVENSYVSPAVRRSIWQALLIVKELKKITGHDPKRVFLEVARGPEESKKKKASRKSRLLQLYKAIQDDVREWSLPLQEKLENTPDRDLASKKLYLYYMQLGHDMYSGEEIDLNDLFSDKKYDIDHIYPQSKTKDDSLLNNMVLVRSEENRIKGDNYPIPAQFRKIKLWNCLKAHHLITEEKYKRLTRRDPFRDDELAGFISRQLVETRQATKVAGDILEECLPESKIVYSKANAVSRFRQEHDFIKCRSVNDYHHAKDAYLNIVVGNVYYTKFTDNPYHFIQDEVRKKGKKYSLNCMFDYSIERHGVKAWVAENHESLQTVQHYMHKNNILFTRYATEKHGGLFDQQPKKKGSGNLLSLKRSDRRFDPEKYGGYNKPSIDYFMLVESDGNKGSRKRTVEGVPVYLAGAGEEQLLAYCENTLGLRHSIIRIPEIKINSLFCIDGYPMHLSGKSNKRLAMKNAVQLNVSEDNYKRIKKIENITSKLAQDSNFKITDQDELTKQDTLSVYEELLSKATNTVYAKRPAGQGVLMKEQKDTFEKLPLPDQCQVIMQILHLFQCRFLSANLTMINGVQKAGVFTISNEMTKNKCAYLIHQSVTGLFQQSVDLLHV